MFTGIVQATGQLRVVEERGGDVYLRIAAGELPMDNLQLGDSIAVCGVCLTVVDFDAGSFGADVSIETLEHTTLGSLQAGARVNLERSLRLADSIGGHLVSGHVDGVGKVSSRAADARSVRFGIVIDDKLARYVARKGSVTVDGTSLTVNDVAGSEFFVNIVPHTLERTIMGDYAIGSSVNIEVDLVARYLERLLEKE